MARLVEEEGANHGRLVRVPAGAVLLEGNLSRPERSSGIVLFAHGSGSGRHSPRNRAVAKALNAGDLATLLFDLLTPQEEAVDSATGRLRFDINLLADRLVAVADWLTEGPEARGLPLGLFGASTGAAAALTAAARRPQVVRSVVSRGGRPDLAGPALARVLAPTLLIVGERDASVLPLNREAQKRLRGKSALEIVPQATHLFEEPGALEKVAALARDWFLRHLSGPIEVSPDSRAPGPRPGQ